MHMWGFPGGLCDKESTCQCMRLRRWDTIPFLGQEDPPEEEMATHSFQYSCLENYMDRGAWQAIVLGSQRVRHN